MPVRLLRRPDEALHLLSVHGDALPAPHLRAAAGPDRHLRGRAPRRVREADGGRDGGAFRGGARTGGGEPGWPAPSLLRVEAGVQLGDGAAGGAGVLPAAAGGRREVPAADGDEPAEPVGAFVPPGAEAGADDRGPGRVGGDPDLAPGGGAAVPAARLGLDPTSGDFCEPYRPTR